MRQTERSKSENTCHEMHDLNNNATNLKFKNLKLAQYYLRSWKQCIIFFWNQTM